LIQLFNEDFLLNNGIGSRRDGCNQPPYKAALPGVVMQMLD
jgi:hypothetical protein